MSQLPIELGFSRVCYGSVDSLLYRNTRTLDDSVREIETRSDSDRSLRERDTVSAFHPQMRRERNPNVFLIPSFTQLEAQNEEVEN